MSPWPSNCSAPPWSMMVRESILLDTWNAIRVGMLALIRPVITSTEGRCVARIRWIPAARAFRSEEHTSELQSLMRISYAVFCLKKNKTQPHYKIKIRDKHTQVSSYNTISEINKE